ncbi:acetyl-coenzyme A synthetase, cytoplasmic [Trichonephila clavipes]|nr:acetyl-coenzyme A synthetase, cytoplasmic [Trichonephila clavipes]
MTADIDTAPEEQQLQLIDLQSGHSVKEMLKAMTLIDLLLKNFHVLNLHLSFTLHFLDLVGKELPLILASKNSKDMLKKRRVSPSQSEAAARVREIRGILELVRQHSTDAVKEGNDPQDNDKITYRELLRRVCRFANVLKSKGVQKGDMVAIYMPMILELVVAMFACARIGAVHSVVFGGYSSDSLAERILDGNCKIIVTADGVFRGTKLVNLKSIVDKAVAICKKKDLQLKAVIVVKHQVNLFSTKKGLTRTNDTPKNVLNGYNLEVLWDPSLDVWWHEEMMKVNDVCEPVWVDAEHILFTLYTSGSTGKPKGCVHTTGGYMIYGALSFKYVFDYFPGDVFFCTGDIGWLTGHTYIVYGSLLNTATCILYEGVPTHPDAGRYWEIVEKYGVTQFYTAPTAIRTLMRYDDAYVTKYDRSTLRVLASVGEPINRDAWFWYHRVVGEGRCPIVDTFWQTETGGHLLTPIPFCTPLKPGCASLPFFGVEPTILDEDGNEIEGPGKGYLVIKRPWPAIMRTVFGNHERFEETYFRRYPGYYFTGDGK